MPASKLLGVARGAVVAIVVLLAAAVPASAAVIVDFSGSFVNYEDPPSYHVILNGGSFSGSFTLEDELPLDEDTTLYFTAFTVNLYDSSHTLIYSFSDSATGHYGFASSAHLDYYGGDIVDAFGPDSSYFQLVFPHHFTGTGSASSTGSGSYSYTYVAALGQYGYVASAFASVRSTPVPEAPAALTLVAGLAAVLALGFAGRRPAAKV